MKLKDVNHPNHDKKNREPKKQLKEHNDVRRVTSQLLELMDEGILSPRAVAEAALNFMSESEVAEMARINELLPEMFDNETGQEV